MICRRWSKQKEKISSITLSPIRGHLSGKINENDNTQLPLIYFFESNKVNNTQQVNIFNIKDSKIGQIAKVVQIFPNSYQIDIDDAFLYW